MGTIPRRSKGDSVLRMFVNGQAMSGGSLNDALAEATFVGAARTAPRYRFWAFGDEFPGLQPAADGGASIAGELYEVDYRLLRERLLPREPEELELGVIELDDGSGTLSMVVRAGAEAGRLDITEHGGWRAYLETR